MNAMKSFNQSRPLWRMAFVLGMGLLSGCATLTTGTMQIDVDVYKGPLTKTTDAQWVEIEAIIHQAKISVKSLNENVQGVMLHSKKSEKNVISCNAPTYKTTIDSEILYLKEQVTKNAWLSDDYQQDLANLTTLKIMCGLVDDLNNVVQGLESERSSVKQYDTLKNFVDEHNKRVKEAEENCKFSLLQEEGDIGEQGSIRDYLVGMLSRLDPKKLKNQQKEFDQFELFVNNWKGDQACNMQDMMLELSTNIDQLQKTITSIDLVMEKWEKRFELYKSDVIDCINTDQKGGLINVRFAGLKQNIQVLQAGFKPVHDNVNFGNRFSYVRGKARQVAKAVDTATSQMLPAARTMDLQVNLLGLRKEVDGFLLDIEHHPLLQDYNTVDFDISRSGGVSGVPGVSKIFSLNNALTFLTNMNDHIHAMQEKLKDLSAKAVGARDQHMKQWASEQLEVLKKKPYASFVDLQKRSGEIKSQEDVILALENIEPTWKKVSDAITKFESASTEQALQDINKDIKAINDILLDGIVKQDKTQALQTYKNGVVELAKFSKETIAARKEVNKQKEAVTAATTGAASSGGSGPVSRDNLNAADAALNQAINTMKNQSEAINNSFPDIQSTLKAAFIVFVNGLKIAKTAATLAKLQPDVQSMSQRITAKEQSSGEVIAQKSLPTGDALDTANAKAKDLQAILDDARMESLLKVSKLAAQMKLIAGNLTHIMIPYVSNDKFLRLAQVVSINSTGEYSNLLESRSKSLMEQLYKGTKSKRLPTSFYLDGSEASMFPNLYNWFEAETPGIYADGRIKTYEHVFADYHWAKLNTVYASGMGETRMAFIRDEIGNWDLHSFSSDPTELMTAYKDATISGIQAVGKLMSGTTDPSMLQKLGGLLAGPVPDQDRIMLIQAAHMDTWEALAVKNKALQDKLAGMTDEKAKTDAIKAALTEAQELINEKITDLPSY